MPSGQNCIAHGYITVNTTAKTLNASSTQGIPSQAKGLVITVESAGVRLRLDSVTASTGVANGTLLNAGDVLILDSWTVPKTNWRSVMLGMSFIADVAGSTGNISIEFFD
jgi:hypothetical protein